MEQHEIDLLVQSVREKEILLNAKEQALEDQQEELLSQKEELTSAVEELLSKNEFLTKTLAELQQRNQELDQILYRASHDLKTPVSSIFGLIEILRSGPMTVDQANVADHISEKAKQMDSLLISLSNLSTAFFSPLDLQLCSVRECVYQSWFLIKEKYNVRLECPFPDIQFRTDPQLLTILIRCVLENAVRYRPTQHGVVVVRCEVDTSSLILSVVDDGEGVAREIEGQIFAMFYRGSEKSKGPGLGLYIARRIAERLKGKITLDRESGQTRFVIELPRGEG